MDDIQIEQVLQSKGLTAPRVTQQDVWDSIDQEYFFTAANGYIQATLADLVAEGKEAVLPADFPRHLGFITFCVLVLKNGHRIVGVNTGPVSADNFDAELGRALAKQNAIDQVWPLLGFLLREKITRGEV